MRTLDLTRSETTIADAPIDHLARLDSLYLGSCVSTEAQANYFKNQGIVRVIDLKGKEETQVDERKLFNTAGMDYASFPVKSLNDIDFDELQKFGELVQQDNKKTLIYCMSGNRVAALLGLYLALIEGHPKQRVYDLINKLGLTKEGLREQVKQRLFG